MFNRELPGTKAVTTASVCNVEKSHQCTDAMRQLIALLRLQKPFGALIEKLTEATNAVAGKMTVEVENNRAQMSKLLQRNTRVMDGILERLEHLDSPSLAQSASTSYSALAAGAESYAKMISDLNQLLRHLKKTSFSDSPIDKNSLVILHGIFSTMSRATQIFYIKQF